MLCLFWLEVFWLIGFVTLQIKIPLVGCNDIKRASFFHAILRSRLIKHVENKIYWIDTYLQIC